MELQKSFFEKPTGGLFCFKKWVQTIFLILYSLHRGRIRYIETHYNLFCGHTMLQSHLNSGKATKSDFFEKQAMESTPGMGGGKFRGWGGKICYFRDDLEWSILVV